MSGPAPRALALMGQRAWQMQFDPARVARLRALATVPSEPWVPDLDAATPPDLAATEVLLTGWGVPLLDAAALDRVPRLRAVLHCAGSVRGFVTDALWERGVQVSTSADLNAEPVAEYTLAAVIMAGKKAPFLAADARTSRTDWSYRGARGRLTNSGLTIGLVGFSRVGRRVVALLRQLHDVTVLVSDPWADPAEVRAAGATLVELEDVLPRLDVLSIHAPDLPSTRHLVGAAQLAALPDHATVINTARGALVDTAALEAECVSGRLHAILDVTDPEPLPAGSPLYDLPNVMLTPHVAGSLDTEARRMTDGALEELARVGRGEPLARPVLREELARSA